MPSALGPGKRRAAGASKSGRNLSGNLDEVMEKVRKGNRKRLPLDTASL